MKHMVAVSLALLLVWGCDSSMDTKRTLEDIGALGAVIVVV